MTRIGCIIVSGCAVLLLLLSADAGQLRQQEMNLWSKLELSMQSTQSELDGLKRLVSSLQTDSQKLTDELTLSRADYSKLQQLQENTAASYSQLLTDYQKLKAVDQFKDRILWVGTIVAVLGLLSNIVSTILWAKGIKLPRLLEIWM